MKNPFNFSEGLFTVDFEINLDVFKFEPKAANRYYAKKYEWRRGDLYTPYDTSFNFSIESFYIKGKIVYNFVINSLPIFCESSYDLEIYLNVYLNSIGKYEDAVNAGIIKNLHL